MYYAEYFDKYVCSVIGTIVNVANIELIIAANVNKPKYIDGVKFEKTKSINPIPMVNDVNHNALPTVI